MAEITVALIKELRDRTDCGMMDAKRALQETGGDVEKAIENLRKKGELKADAKAARSTAEGKIGIAVSADGKTAALAEVLCETDFTANNENFLRLVEGIAKAVAENPGDPAELSMPGGKETVTEAMKAFTAKTGENSKLGRHVRLSLCGTGLFGTYLHSDGKLGVLVEVEGDDSAEAVKTLAKDLAMHAAAMSPISLDRSGVPQDVLSREREIAREQARASGKPDNLLDKIADGKLNAFFKERCFVDQPFVKENKVSVSEQVAAVGKQVGKPLKLAAYARVRIGE